METSSSRGPTYWVTQFMVACGYLALGAVAAIYSVAASHVTVTTQEQLARVSFGWPLAWFSQNQSRYRFESFPVTVHPIFSGNKGLSQAQREALGLPLNDIDWLLAAGSALFWGVILWLLLRFAFDPMVARIRRIAQRPR